MMQTLHMYILYVCPTYVIYVSLYCDFVTNTIWDTYKGARHGVLSCMEKSFDNSSDMSFKAWHSMIKANLNKNEKFVTNTFAASKMYLHFIRSLLHEIDFRTWFFVYFELDSDWLWPFCDVHIWLFLFFFLWKPPERINGWEGYTLYF